MTTITDTSLWATTPVWFDDQRFDHAGRPLGMYSVVTPLETYAQLTAGDDEAIVVEPGCRCVVLGVAQERPDLIWAEIDDPGPFVNSHICINPALVAYLGEVGGPGQSDTHA